MLGLAASGWLGPSLTSGHCGSPVPKCGSTKLGPGRVHAASGPPSLTACRLLSYQVEPNTKLFPAVFVLPTHQNVVQFELGKQKARRHGWEFSQARVCSSHPGRAGRTVTPDPFFFPNHTEHHAAVGRHVPERAQEPSPAVPTKAGGADADAGLLEPNAQPLPSRGHAACWRAAGLGCAVPGAIDDDGLTHPGGEQVRAGRLRSGGAFPSYNPRPAPVLGSSRS